MPLEVGFSSFYRPGGGGIELIFARGVGIRPSKKLPREMVRLGID